MEDMKTQETVSPSVWRGVAFALPVSVLLWWTLFNVVRLILRAVS